MKRGFGMSISSRIFRSRAPSTAAAACGPQTTLVPSPAFDPTSTPQPPHPDLPLVMQEFHIHRQHTPNLTWPDFLRLLERRHRFFAEERAEREAKLATLLAAPRFTP